ncbi:hypothetical protein [Dictyobacter alpinus]|nr:hypothetical protein [Dictyobacter alpinus]
MLMDTPVLKLPKPNNSIHPKNKISFFLTLAAAALLIMGSLQLFTKFGAHLPLSQISTTASTANNRSTAARPSMLAKNKKHDLTSLRKTIDWSAVIMTHLSEDGKDLMIENYDPIHNKSALLFTSSNATVVDGVSHQGDNLIYHMYDRKSQKTVYAFLSGEQYYFSGRGLNAIWSTDDREVFFNTADGSLWKIDTKQHDSLPIKLPQVIHADQLSFYRNHFLYYVRGYALYRISVDASPSIEQQVVYAASSKVFWMDPISEDIYYVKKHVAEYDIYKHQSNAALASDLPIQPNGIPVGYTNDAPNIWAIMYVSWNSQTGGFDIRKTSAKQALISDIVDGKVRALCGFETTDGAICDNSLALSPMGSILLVGGVDKAQAYHLWSINLNTKTQTELTNPAGKSPVQLIGWDKLGVD